MDILLNPMVLSVSVMIAMCLMKINVYIAILLSSVFCGLLGGIGLIGSINVFIEGMKNNCEYVFNIAMLGILIEAMNRAEVGPILSQRMGKLISKTTWYLCLLLLIIGILSETVILVGTSFVPIMVPPLLNLFNQNKIDRRKLVVAIVLGIQIGYVCVPTGFGLMFQQIVQTSLRSAGLEVSILEITKGNIVALVAMLAALALNMFIYRKPRKYEEEIKAEMQASTEVKMQKRQWIVVIAAVLAIIIQAITNSTNVGVFFAVILLIFLGAIPRGEMEKAIMDGVTSMSFIAFVMMGASGFAAVVQRAGQIDRLANVFVVMVRGHKLIAAFVLLLLGLLITLGIGTAWGTVPIVAAVIVPVGIHLGFSPIAITSLISMAACLGASGAPGSDQSLIPTMGFNVDGQHDHIRDTCIPEFICINLPILFIGPLSVLFL